MLSHVFACPHFLSDNFYTSAKLLDDLHQFGIYGTGAFRVVIPSDMKMIKEFEAFYVAWVITGVQMNLKFNCKFSSQLNSPGATTYIEKLQTNLYQLYTQCGKMQVQYV